jgi:HPr kinase/phosphorylase
VADQPLHASAVAVLGRAALITGPSGAGKSGLALALMSMGARLVADDGVILTRDGGRLVARAPEAIRGLIEARGVGLLRAAPLDDVPLAVVIDLGTTESERLPPPRTTMLMGVELPLLHKVESPHFAAAVLQYLAEGRSA